MENMARKESMEPQDDPIMRLKGLEDQIAQIKDKLESMNKAAPSNKLSMIVFSGDLD